MALKGVIAFAAAAAVLTAAPVAALSRTQVDAIVSDVLIRAAAAAGSAGKGGRLAMPHGGVGSDYYDLCDQYNGALGYPCHHVPVETPDGFVLDVIRLPQQRSNATAGAPARAAAAAARAAKVLAAAEGPGGRSAAQLEKLIPAPRVTAAGKKAQPYPVILMHGLLDSAITYGANKLPELNLATIVHDLGYDVWIPNSRGNHYSQTNWRYPGRNETYFMRIDCDLMARYDVPAVINRVLATAAAEAAASGAVAPAKVGYAGHSQGTLQMFAALSHWCPECAGKLDTFVALAPVARINHMTSPIIGTLARLGFPAMIRIFGVKWFLTHSTIPRWGSDFCTLFNLAEDVCKLVIAAAVGFGNTSNLDWAQLPTDLRYDPGGTSVNNMAHWAFMTRSGKFAAYDHGAAINQELYGTPVAPSYDPARITGPPTVLLSGSQDSLADPIDVQWLKATMPAAVQSPLGKEISDYDHMDFVWGLDAHTRLYPTVVAAIAKYRSL